MNGTSSKSKIYLYRLEIHFVMAETEFGFGFKVILVGNSGVGKTSAIQKFCTGKFPEQHNKTLVSQFYEKSFDIQESADAIDLMIWDTPGRECLHLLAEDTYIDANICVVFYSLADKSSFDAIPHWIENVKKIAGAVQIVIVENKVDLVDKAQVSPNDAKRMARQFDAPLFRISVKENLNLKPLFNHLASTLQSKYLNSLNTLPRGGDAFFVGDFDELDVREDDTPRNPDPQDNGVCRLA